MVEEGEEGEQEAEKEVLRNLARKGLGDPVGRSQYGHTESRVVLCVTTNNGERKIANPNAERGAEAVGQW